MPLVLAGVVFLPASSGADWITDDRYLIASHLRPGDVVGEWTTPTHAHAADVVGGYLWRPLTSTVYQLHAAIFGRTPGPFRVLSACVHLVNIVLIWAVSRRLGAPAAAAGLGALLFALHPLAPDAVCWISDLYDVLAASFLLLGGWVALGSGRLGVRVAGSAALFLCALLSKEAALAWAAALPAALLLLRGWRPAGLHGVALGLTAALHASWHASIVGAFERSAMDMMRQTPFIRTWLDYLWWPVGMPVEAGYTHLLTPGQIPLSVGGVSVLVMLTASLLAVWLRPSPAVRNLAVGLGIWCVMVAPGALAAASFLNQAARYLYLPLAVAVPALVASVAASADGLPPSRRQLVAFLAGAWILSWAPRTLTRIGDWSSEPALYLAEHEAEPQNPFAAKELGRLLFGAGEVDAGLRLWAEALERPPASRFVMDVQAERLELAQAAASVGRAPLAVASLDAFIASEARAGRPVDPSVTALRARLDEGAP